MTCVALRPKAASLPPQLDSIPEGMSPGYIDKKFYIHSDGPKKVKMYSLHFINESTTEKVDKIVKEKRLVVFLSKDGHVTIGFHPKYKLNGKVDQFVVMPDIGKYALTLNKNDITIHKLKEEQYQNAANNL